MDKKEFKKLVRPYITRGAYLNKELILQDFESKINGERHIIIENKLIYIPIEERPWTEKETNEATGTFVYSENSKMYCWASGFKKYTDSWYETDLFDWNPEYMWILRNQPMSAMNNGMGWDFGAKGKTYYVLEIPKLKFMNWVLRYPLNLK